MEPNCMKVEGKKKKTIILLENWRHVLKAPGKTDGFFQVIFS